MLGLLSATERSVAPSRRRAPLSFVYPQGPARGYGTSNISGGVSPTSRLVGGTTFCASTVVPALKRIGRVLVLLVLIGAVLAVTHLITGQQAGNNEWSTPRQPRSTDADSDSKSTGMQVRIEVTNDDGRAVKNTNVMNDKVDATGTSQAPQRRPLLHVVKGTSEVPLPSFSIVMLSYKSPKSLQRTLNSLFASKLIYHPWLAEVIVYFQARRVNEVAAQPRGQIKSGNEELGREGNIDPDEGLVKEVYDSYSNPPTSTEMEEEKKSGGVKTQHSPKPYVILGDGTNLPVAQATARAVRAAKGDLILYLECDRPVIGGLSPAFTDFNSHQRRDNGKGNDNNNNKDWGKGREEEDEGSYGPLASFAYAQIAAAVDHLYFNSGANENKKESNDGDAGAHRPVADVFRLQLYSGPHIAAPPTISLHKAQQYSEGGHQQQQQSMYALPKDTYGDNPQRHCLATPWYHPSTSSEMLSVSNYNNAFSVSVDNQTQSSRSVVLDESLRDICANPKHAKKKMGNVFATAYCKHWRKINHIGRDNNKPTLPLPSLLPLPPPLGGSAVIPPHSSDSATVQSQEQQQQQSRRGNPFSIPQQDMCDSFCFLEWALQGGGAGRVEKGGAEDHGERQPTLWSVKNADDGRKGGITVPKIAARGVLMDRHYKYSDALMSAALHTGSDVADQSGSSKTVMSVLPLRRPLYPYDESSKNTSSHSVEKEVSLSSRSSGLPVICLTSEDCNWTNQPTMYKKEWYMANIAAPCEASTDYCIGAPGRASAVRQELFFVKKRSVWADRKHRICLTRGLFVHDEVDNRE